jgi:hypothetical protein
MQTILTHVPHEVETVTPATALLHQIRADLRTLDDLQSRTDTLLSRLRGTIDPHASVAAYRRLGLTACRSTVGTIPVFFARGATLLAALFLNGGRTADELDTLISDGDFGDHEAIAKTFAEALGLDLQYVRGLTCEWCDASQEQLPPPTGADFRKFNAGVSAAMDAWSALRRAGLVA